MVPGVLSSYCFNVKRVLIFGPGASGKSTFAARLGEITGLTVIELDKIFWQSDLVPMPQQEWATVQQELIQKDEWIMDGDLGPYDDVEGRLCAADTIIFLDFSVARCAWRALRRSRERFDFWIWLLGYRQHSRPLLMAAIAKHAHNAKLHVLQTPRAQRQFLEACVL